jgi:hypothetical protein
LFALGNLIQIPGWIFLAAAVLALGRVWGGAAHLPCRVPVVRAHLRQHPPARRRCLAPVEQSASRTRLLAQLDARPIRSMVFLRVLFQTVPALNYALALSGVRFREYMIATLLGLPLPIALYCLFFDFLARLLRLG